MGDDSQHGGPTLTSSSLPRSTKDTETRALPRSGSKGYSPIDAGTMVSRYHVLEEIGRGGMGRVLRAYDPKLQREVALKEVRGDALDDSATERLVAEARAMAKLSHPNVVAVYDVDDSSSRGVVLVMEYVSGMTLRTWLRTAQRPWNEIVAHFCAAGRGLATAHRVGLLHRDFKPANVLLAIDGTVKVTDFGLAKLSSDHALDSLSGDSVGTGEFETEAGVVLGTPRYMAPEQLGGEVLTAAADQYAFCVALWEALCGAPPFTGRVLDKLEDDKRSGPPVWPESTTPARIVSAIVRGLSPTVSSRWPTMDALLEALGWDPARARARRLRIAAGVLLAGMGTAGVVAWQYRKDLRCSGAERKLDGIWDEARRARARQSLLATEKPYASTVWERVEADLDAYAEDFVGMHTEACEATVLRAEQSDQMLDLRMACLNRAAQDLEATVDALADADDELLRNAHELTGGLRPLPRCADTESLSADVEPPGPDHADDVQQAHQHLAQARVKRLAGRYPAARDSIDAATALATTTEYGPLEAEALFEEGLLFDLQGEYDRAEHALSASLERASRWRQWEVMADSATTLIRVVGARKRDFERGLSYASMAKGLAEGDRSREAEVIVAMAAVLLRQGKPAEAVNEYRRAIRMTAEELGPDHIEVSMARTMLAVALGDQGRYAEAEAEHRDALRIAEASLGADHPWTMDCRGNLAVISFRQGHYERAEQEFRTVLESQARTLGHEHPTVALNRNNVAAALHHQGRFEEAEVELRKALEARVKALGPDHPDVAASRNNLGAILGSLGRHQEAEAEYRQALRDKERALGPSHADTLRTRFNLAKTLVDREDYATAQAELRGTLEGQLESLGPDHPDVAESRRSLADVLRSRGQLDAAEAELRQALSAFEHSVGQDHHQTATALRDLAEVLGELGRATESLPMLEQAWSRCEAEEVSPRTRSTIAFALARILWDAEPPARDRVRARQLAETAHTSLRATESPDEDELQALRTWLDEHTRTD